MSSLASIAPEFAIEVGAALAGYGRDELASQLSVAVVQRCTYDSSANAGYIYLAHPAPSIPFAKLASQVAETIPFFGRHGFNVDVDYDGNIRGIELLSRDDVFTRLRAVNAL